MAQRRRSVLWGAGVTRHALRSTQKVREWLTGRWLWTEHRKRDRLSISWYRVIGMTIQLTLTRLAWCITIGLATASPLAAAAEPAQFVQSPNPFCNKTFVAVGPREVLWQEVARVDARASHHTSFTLRSGDRVRSRVYEDSVGPGGAVVRRVVGRGDLRFPGGSSITWGSIKPGNVWRLSTLVVFERYRVSARGVGCSRSSASDQLRPQEVAGGARYERAL